MGILTTFVFSPACTPRRLRSSARRSSCEKSTARETFSRSGGLKKYASGTDVGRRHTSSKLG
nr:MAG: hypothetical protein [Molluscum contagiosum virus]